MKIIHIVNGNSAAGTLKSALKKDNIYITNIVYCFNDFLSVGPLFQIESKIGQKKRKTYLSELIREIESDYPLREITNNISEFLNVNFNDYDKVTVWHGNNSPERILKLLCCSVIENKNLYEVDISKLQTEERIPLAVGECTPESIKTLLNMSKKIHQEDYTKSAQKWNQITSSKSKLRLYNFGEIENAPENYYDQLIIEQCTNEFALALKIVGKVLGKSNQLIGDTFITYRLLQLIKAKSLKYDGDLNNIKTLLVKT